MSITRQVQYSILGLIVGMFALWFSGTSLRGDITPVVLVGQPAPGTANGRFSEIVGGASVNASGDMTFMTWLDVGGVPSAGIFAIYGGIVSPVALEGQPAPDSSNLFFGGGLSGPQINNNGDIVFASNFASNAAGANFGWGVFLYSGGVLQTVISSASPIMGPTGQTFNEFGGARINDNGDIAFLAVSTALAPSTGLFLMSQGKLTPIVSQSGFGFDIALNNHDDIVFRNAQSGLSEYSGGTIQPVVGPGYGLSTGHQAGAPSINDDGDIVFVDYVLVPSGRGGSLSPVANAVFRWRQGMLDKIAAAGDPVPGIAGRQFSMDFENPQINESGIVFRSSSGQPVSGLICRYQQGVLSVIAREDEPIPGISATLNFIGAPAFDNKQGSLMTFWARPGVLGTATGPEGLYSATTGPFPLLFPQIADGTSAGGGWRTTFILANRSQETNSPLTTPPAGPATATVSFYNDTGAPMTVSIGGQPQNQITISIPALGVAQFQTDGAGPLQTGWARVQSDHSLSGIALFGFYDRSGNFVGEVGDPAAVPLRSMSLFVQAGSSTSTGIALANPNAAAASVTLTLKDANSNAIATSSITVPPMGHLAKYANEIFGAVPPGEFNGKMDVVSTLPLVAITLRQRGSVFTSLPVIP